LDGVEVERGVDANCDNGVECHVIVNLFPFIYQLRLPFEKLRHSRSLLVVFLDEVFGRHHVPDLWILDFDRVESQLTLVHAALDFCFLVRRLTRFNVFQLLSKRGYSLEDDVDELDVETSGQKGGERLLTLLLLLRHRTDVLSFFPLELGFESLPDKWLRKTKHREKDTLGGKEHFTSDIKRRVVIIVVQDVFYENLDRVRRERDEDHDDVLDVPRDDSRTYFLGDAGSQDSLRCEHRRNDGHGHKDHERDEHRDLFCCFG